MVFVGLCSGAVLAVEGALALQARGVCLIDPPSAIDFLHGMSLIDRGDPEPWVRLVPGLKKIALHLRWVSVVLLKVLLVAPGHFRTNVLRTLSGRGADVFVLGSYDDISPLPKYPSLNHFFGAQFIAPSGFDVTLVPGLDHSMHAADGRARSHVLLVEHVVARHAHDAVHVGIRRWPGNRRGARRRHDLSAGRYRRGLTVDGAERDATVQRTTHDVALLSGRPRRDVRALATRSCRYRDGVVRTRVRHGVGTSPRMPTRALHAAVADDEQVRVHLVGHLDQRVRGRAVDAVNTGSRRPPS